MIHVNAHNKDTKNHNDQRCNGDFHKKFDGKRKRRFLFLRRPLFLPDAVIILFPGIFILRHAYSLRFRNSLLRFSLIYDSLK